MIIIILSINAKKYIAVALDGISAWTFNVLPCLLPFMILTKLIIDLDTMEIFTKPFSKTIMKLYKVPSCASYIYFMSILAGYPVGAKMTADLYENGKISKNEAYKMCSFCSNSGPMFIIGTVGALLMNSAKIGLILFISHVLGALLNGLIYRGIKIKDEKVKLDNVKKDKGQASFGDIVLNSVQSVLSVGAIICLFFILIEMMSPIINLLPSSLIPLAKGIIELTKGCIEASNLTIFVATLTCSFLISFGGISTILQSMAMLKKLKMPLWLFSVQKITHGLISTILTAIIFLII